MAGLALAASQKLLYLQNTDTSFIFKFFNIFLENPHSEIKDSLIKSLLNKMSDFF
jgi:hypothetical protein